METINNILPNYCSLPICKRLKELGFDIPCNSYYEVALTTQKDTEHGYSGSFGWKEGETNIQSGYNTNKTLNSYTNKNWLCCSRPTHSLAIEWIYLNYGIWIYTHPVRPFDDGDNYPKKVWVCNFDVNELRHLHVNTNNGLAINHFHTPEEAIEAGLAFVLKEVITA